MVIVTLVHDARPIPFPERSLTQRNVQVAPDTPIKSSVHAEFVSLAVVSPGIAVSRIDIERPPTSAIA